MSNVIGQPAYRQVADDLRRLIAAGDLSVGEPIPSTTQLRQQYSVSVTVVRAAIGELRTEGLLRGQPGKAVYVVATPDEVAADSHSLDSLARDLTDLRSQLDRPSGGAGDLDDVRDAVQQLRRQVARLQTQLIELYGKTGHAYPRETAEPTTRQRRRSAG